MVDQRSFHVRGRDFFLKKKELLNWNTFLLDPGGQTPNQQHKQQQHQAP